MRPIEFKEQNCIFAKDQSEYLPLPALKLDTERGDIVFCSYLTFRERIRVLFTGRIWVNLLSFNRPLTPSYLTTKKKDLIIKAFKPTVRKNWTVEN